MLYKSLKIIRLALGILKNKSAKKSNNFDMKGSMDKVDPRREKRETKMSNVRRGMLPSAFQIYCGHT